VTSVANHRVFESYGQLKSETNAAVDHLFAFTGRMLDEDTGLQQHLNRWYDPKVGRWLSEDPIGFDAGDVNVYRYVGNEPGNGVDLQGLEKVTPGPLESEDCTIIIVFGHTPFVRTIITQHSREYVKDQAAGVSSRCRVGTVCCGNERVEFSIPKAERILDAPLVWRPIEKDEAFPMVGSLVNAALKDAQYFNGWCNDDCSAAPCKEITVKFICQPDAAKHFQDRGASIEIASLNTTAAKLCGEVKVDTETKRIRDSYYPVSPWYVGTFSVDCAQLMKRTPKEWHSGTW